eukprot:1732249-Rhodomonas_salina.2
MRVLYQPTWRRGRGGGRLDYHATCDCGSLLGGEGEEGEVEGEKLRECPAYCMLLMYAAIVSYYYVTL